MVSILTNTVRVYRGYTEVEYAEGVIEGVYKVNTEGLRVYRGVYRGYTEGI